MSYLDIETKKISPIVEELNTLLADYHIYYQNLRGFHWNVLGKNFFDLHEKFEELYTDARIKIDEIAERILTLQGIPLHTFNDYVNLATVPVGNGISKDEEAVHLVVSSLSELLKIERIILELADNAQDEGTNAMMSDFIAEQEKTLWMMNAWLG